MKVAPGEERSAEAISLELLRMAASSPRSACDRQEMVRLIEEFASALGVRDLASALNKSAAPAPDASSSGSFVSSGCTVVVVVDAPGAIVSGAPSFRRCNKSILLTLNKNLPKQPHVPLQNGTCCPSIYRASVIFPKLCKFLCGETRPIRK